MELNPLQLQSVNALLRTQAFRDEITSFLEKPFWDPGKDKPDDWNTPHEAGRKRWIEHPAFWLLEVGLLTIFSIAVWARRSRQPLLSQWVHEIPFLSPIAAYQSAIAIGTALACVLVPALFWWYKIPVHDPDPLFGRLLQAKVKAEVPHSKGLIADLLGDRRFHDLVQRALNLNLTTQNWDATVSRLVDAVKDDETFAQLYTDWQGSEPTPHNAIGTYLKYVARKLLFETVLDNPDFRYLYDDISQRRQTIAKWLANIRWEKAKDLLEKPSERPSSKGPEVLSIANVIVLIVLVVVTILKKGADGAPPNLKSDDSSRFEKCADEIAKVHIIIEQVLAAIGQQKPVPPVYVSVQPSPPRNPIELKIPSSIDLTVKSDAHSISDINVKPQTEKTPPCCESPTTEAKPGMHSDVYLVFPDTSEKKSAPTKSKPDDARSTTLNLALDKGVICSYDAKLASSKPWPPDPVEIKVSLLVPNPNADKDNCPKIDPPTKFVTIYAGRTPMYSALFKAYFSIEEEQKRSFIPQRIHRSRDLLIIRVHSQDSP